MKRILPLLVVLSGLGGCAIGSPVIVDTSLSRLELPERPSQAVKAGAGFSGDTFLVLTRDQVAQAPDPGKAEITYNEDSQNDSVFSGTYTHGEPALGHLSLGVSRRHDGPTMGRVKLYLGGYERDKAPAGSGSLALTGAWGHGSQHVATSNNAYVTDTGRNDQDYGAVFGYRVNRGLMLYGGPYYKVTALDVTHRRPSTPDAHFKVDSTARGFNVGLALFAGRYCSWLLEYSQARVDFGSASRQMGNGAFVFDLDLF